MEKEEELFDNVDLESQLSMEDEEVDTTEFMVDTEEEQVDEVDLNEDNEEETTQETKSEKEDEDLDGVDTSEFENNETENTTVNDKSSANNSSSLQLLATTLQAEGVIDLEDDEVIESSEQIINAIKNQIKSNEYSDLTDSQKIYLEALRSGIPEEKVKENLNNIELLNNITTESIESNENLRKELIAQDFIAKGISSDRAYKLADSSIQLGEDLDDAKEAYNSLKAIESERITKESEQLKLKKEKDLEAHKEKLSSLKTRVLEQDEIIPGFKVNSATKEKVYQNMTKVVANDDKGNPLNALNAARLKDPEKIEMIENYLFVLTNGFKDWSNFKSKVKTNAIKDLDKKLKQTQSVSGGSKKIQKSVSEINNGGLRAAFENLKL
jgi:hypothetical protein